MLRPPSRIESSVFQDLIGRPWELHARGPLSFDCVGLLLEMQRRLGRIAADFPSAEGSFDLTRGIGEWKQVEVPSAGDALLLSAAREWHVACVIGPELMIHAKEHVGVAVERFDSPLYRRRIQGAYTWRPKASGLFALSKS